MEIKKSIDCCETCNAFLDDDTEESKEGYCRAAPPIPILTDSQTGRYESVFPRMKKMGIIYLNP